MTSKGTVGLVVVFVGLIALYWASGLLRERTVEREAEARRIFSFQPGDLRSITVKRAGEGAVTAIRDTSGVWAITAPFEHIPPNPIVWGRLAESLARLSSERIVDESPTSLEIYELDPPHLSIEFERDGGEKGTLSFGAVDPTQEYRYLRFGQGPIGLTPVAAFHELDRSLLDLRQRFIFPPSQEGIRRVEYARIYTGAVVPDDPDAYVPEIGEESVRVILDLDPRSQWHMSSPVEAPAKQEKVAALISEVRYAVGRGYIDAPKALALYGLDPPEHLITMGPGKNRPSRTLQLGWAAESDSEGGIYVKLADNPSVFVLAGNLLSVLPESPSAFRQTQLLSGEATSIVRIDYTDRFTTFTLENDPGTGWRLSDPAYDDTDQEAVSRYIAFLKRTGGLTFPENPQETGFDDPDIAIKLTYADQPEPRSILAGYAVPDTNPAIFYAQQDDGAITTIPLGTKVAMRIRPFSFRKKAVFPFAIDAAREIRLTLDGDRFVLKKIGTRWVIAEPAELRLESQADARVILEALRNVEATGIAAPEPSESVMGFGEPVLEVALTLDTDGGERRLLGPMIVGATKASQSRDRFTRIAGRDEIVYVDQDLVDEVRAAALGFVSQ